MNDVLKYNDRFPVFTVIHFALQYVAILTITKLITIASINADEYIFVVSPAHCHSCIIRDISPTVKPSPKTSFELIETVSEIKRKTKKEYLIILLLDNRNTHDVPTNPM